MPKSLGGLIGFVAISVVATIVGMWVVNRVGFLKSLVG